MYRLRPAPEARGSYEGFEKMDVWKGTPFLLEIWKNTNFSYVISTGKCEGECTFISRKGTEELFWTMLPLSRLEIVNYFRRFGPIEKHLCFEKRGQVYITFRNVKKHQTFSSIMFQIRTDFVLREKGGRSKDFGIPSPSHWALLRFLQQNRPKKRAFFSRNFT